MSRKTLHRSRLSQALAVTLVTSMVISSSSVISWADTKKTSTADILQTAQSAGNAAQGLYALLSPGTQPAAYAPVLQSLKNPNASTEAQTIASEADFMADRLPGQVAMAANPMMMMNNSVFSALSGESHSNVSFFVGNQTGVVAPSPVSFLPTSAQYSSVSNEPQIRAQVQAIDKQMTSAVQSDLYESMQFQGTADNAQLTGNDLLFNKEVLPSSQKSVTDATGSVQRAMNAADQAANQIVSGGDPANALAAMEKQVSAADASLKQAQQAYQSAYDLWQKNTQTEAQSVKDFQDQYQRMQQVNPTFAAKLKDEFDKADAERQKTLDAERDALNNQVQSIMKAVKAMSTVSSGQYLKQAEQQAAANSGFFATVSLQVSSAENWLSAHQTSIIQTVAGSAVVAIGGAITVLPIPVLAQGAGYLVGAAGASLVAKGVNGLFSSADPAALQSAANTANAKVAADQSGLATAGSKLSAAGIDQVTADKVATRLSDITQNQQATLMTEAKNGSLSTSAQQLRDSAKQIDARIDGLQADLAKLHAMANGGSIQGVQALTHTLSQDFGNINSIAKSAFGNQIITQANEISGLRKSALSNLGLSTTDMSDLSSSARYNAFTDYVGTTAPLNAALQQDKAAAQIANLAYGDYKSQINSSPISTAFSYISAPADGIYDSVVGLAGAAYRGAGVLMSDSSMQQDGTALWLAHANALDQNPLVSIMYSKYSPLSAGVLDESHSFAQTGLNGSLGIDVANTTWDPNALSASGTKGVWVTNGVPIDASLQGLLGAIAQKDPTVTFANALSQVSTDELARGWLDASDSGVQLGARTLLVLGDKALKVGSEMSAFGGFNAALETGAGALSEMDGVYSVIGSGLKGAEAVSSQIMGADFANHIIGSIDDAYSHPTAGNLAYLAADLGGTAIGMGGATVASERLAAATFDPTVDAGPAPVVSSGLSGLAGDLAGATARATATLTLQVAGGEAGGYLGDSTGEIFGVMAGGRVAQGLQQMANGISQSASLAQDAIQGEDIAAGTSQDYTAQLGGNVIEGLMRNSSLTTAQLESIANGQALDPIDLKPTGTAGVLYNIGSWMNGDSGTGDAFKFNPQNDYVQDAARSVLEQKSNDSSFGSSVTDGLQRAFQVLLPTPSLVAAGPEGMLMLGNSALAGGASSSFISEEDPQTPHQLAKAIESAIHADPTGALADLQNKTGLARAASDANPTDPALLQNYQDALKAETDAANQALKILKLQQAAAATDGGVLSLLAQHALATPGTVSDAAQAKTFDSQVEARQAELDGLRDAATARASTLDPTVAADPIRLAEAKAAEEAALASAADAHISRLSIENASPSDIAAAKQDALEQSKVADQARAELAGQQKNQAVAEVSAIRDKVAQASAAGISEQSSDSSLKTLQQSLARAQQNVVEQAADQAFYSARANLASEQAAAATAPTTLFSGAKNGRVSQAASDLQSATVERAKIQQEGDALRAAQKSSAVASTDIQKQISEALENRAQALASRDSSAIQATDAALKTLERQQVQAVESDAGAQRETLSTAYQDLVNEVSKTETAVSPALLDKIQEFTQSDLSLTTNLPDLQKAIETHYSTALNEIDAKLATNIQVVEIDQARSRGDLATAQALERALQGTSDMDPEALARAQRNLQVLDRAAPANRLMVFDRVLSEGKFLQETDPSKFNDWLKSSKLTPEGFEETWDKYFGKGTTLSAAKAVVNADFGNYKDYVRKTEATLTDLFKKNGLLPENVSAPKTTEDFLKTMESNHVFDDMQSKASQLARVRAEIGNIGSDADRAVMARIYGEAAFTEVFGKEGGRLTGAQKAMLSLFGDSTNAGVDAGGGKTETFMMDQAVHSIILGNDLRGEILVESDSAAQKYVEGKDSVRRIAEAFGLKLVDGTKASTADLITAIHDPNTIVVLDPTSRGHLMNKAAADPQLRNALQQTNLFGYDEVHMAATSTSAAIIGGNVRAPSADLINSDIRLYREIDSRWQDPSFNKALNLGSREEANAIVAKWNVENVEGVAEFNGSITMSDPMLRNLDSKGSRSDIYSIVKTLTVENGEANGYAIAPDANGQDLIYPVNSDAKIETDQISNDITGQIAAALKHMPEGLSLDETISRITKMVRVQDTEMQTGLSAIVENSFARQVGGSATIDGLNRLLKTRIGTESVGVSTTRLDLEKLSLKGDESDNLGEGQMVSHVDMTTDEGKTELAQMMEKQWKAPGDGRNLIIATEDIQTAKFYQSYFEAKGIKVTSIDGFTATDDVNNIAKGKGLVPDQVVIINRRAFTGVDFQMSADLWVVGAETIPEQRMVQLLKRVNRPDPSRNGVRWDATRNLVISNVDALGKSLNFVKENSADLGRIWASEDAARASQLLSNFDPSKVDPQHMTQDQLRDAVELVSFSRQADINSEAAKFAIQDALRARYVIDPLKSLLRTLPEGSYQASLVRSVLDSSLNNRGSYSALSLEDYEKVQTRSDYFRETLNNVSNEAGRMLDTLDSKSAAWKPVNWGRTSDLRSALVEQRSAKAGLDYAIGKLDKIEPDNSRSLTQAKTATEMIGVLKSAGELIVNGSTAVSPSRDVRAVMQGDRAWDSVRNAIQKTDMGRSAKQPGFVLNGTGAQPVPSLASTLAVRATLSNVDLSAITNGYRRDMLADLITAPTISDLRTKLATYGQQANQNAQGLYFSQDAALYSSGSTWTDMTRSVTSSVSTLFQASQGLLQTALPLSTSAIGFKASNLVSILNGNPGRNLWDVPHRSDASWRTVETTALQQLGALAQNPKTASTVSNAIARATMATVPSVGNGKRAISNVHRETLRQIESVALTNFSGSVKVGDGYSVERTKRNGQSTSVLTVSHLNASADLEAVALTKAAILSGTALEIHLPAGDAARVQAFHDLAAKATARGASVRVVDSGDASGLSSYIPLSIRKPGSFLKAKASSGSNDTQAILTLEKAVSDIELKAPAAETHQDMIRLMALADQLKEGMDLGLLRRDHLGNHLTFLIDELSNAISSPNSEKDARAAIEAYLENSVSDAHDQMTGELPGHAQVITLKGVQSTVAVMQRSLSSLLRVKNTPEARVLLNRLDPVKAAEAGTKIRVSSVARTTAYAALPSPLARYHQDLLDILNAQPSPKSAKARQSIASRAVLRGLVTQAYSEAPASFKAMASAQIPTKNVSGTPLMLVVPNEMDPSSQHMLRDSFSQVKVITASAYQDYLTARASVAQNARHAAIQAMLPQTKNSVAPNTSSRNNSPEPDVTPSGSGLFSSRLAVSMGLTPTRLATSAAAGLILVAYHYLAAHGVVPSIPAILNLHSVIAEPHNSSGLFDALPGGAFVYGILRGLTTTPAKVKTVSTKARAVAAMLYAA